MVFDSLGGTRPENGRRRCFGPVKAGSLAPWNAGAFPDGEALALLKIHAFPRRFDDDRKFNST
jgi:hypothetical protein